MKRKPYTKKELKILKAGEEAVLHHLECEACKGLCIDGCSVGQRVVVAVLKEQLSVLYDIQKDKNHSKYKLGSKCLVCKKIEELERYLYSLEGFSAPLARRHS